MWDRRKAGYTEHCFMGAQKGNWPLVRPFQPKMVPKVHLHSEKLWWGRVWMSKEKVAIGHGSVTHCEISRLLWNALWESVSPLKRGSETCSSLNCQHLLPHLSRIIRLSNWPSETFIKKSTPTPNHSNSNSNHWKFCCELILGPWFVPIKFIQALLCFFITFREPQSSFSVTVVAKSISSGHFLNITSKGFLSPENSNVFAPNTLVQNRYPGSELCHQN